MRELLLERACVREASTGAVVYTLTPQKEAMLSENFTVQSKLAGAVADIKKEHVLFTPAKLPKVTVSMKEGAGFCLKRELEQLTDVLKVDGADLSVKGDPLTSQFELRHKDQSVADFHYGDAGKMISVKEACDELLIVLFAFAVELARN